MRIAIDCTSVLPGGTATYLQGLLVGLSLVDRYNSYIALVSQHQADIFSGLKLSDNIRAISVKCPTRLPMRIAWEQLALPPLLSRYNIDLLYSPSNTLSILAPCPIVFSIRNANFYSDLQLDQDLQERLRHLFGRWMSKAFAWRARKVILTSYGSREMVCGKLGIPAEKAAVVYHGLDLDRFIREKSFEVNYESLKLRGERPYLLTVSNINPHKNYPALLRAFAKLCRGFGITGYDLVIAGRVVNTDLFHLMQRIVTAEGIDERVRFLGQVPYSAIPSLYAGASLFVFPSFIETFGLPLAEAMASGVPVIASSTSVMPEICGSAAVYFDPHSIDSIASTIFKVLCEKDLQDELSSRGRERAKCFSLEKQARETIKILEQASRE